MALRNASATPFLLGVIATLVFTVLTQQSSLPTAYADGGSGDGGGIFMVTNNGSSGQGRDVLFLVESTEMGKRLAIYEYNNGRLDLGAVRNIEYDLEFQAWSKKGFEQKPSVKDQEELSEKARKAREAKRKKTRNK